MKGVCDDIKLIRLGSNLFESVCQGLFNGENQAALFPGGHLYVTTAHLQSKMKSNSLLHNLGELSNT